MHLVQTVEFLLDVVLVERALGPFLGRGRLGHGGGLLFLAGRGSVGGSHRGAKLDSGDARCTAFPRLYAAAVPEITAAGTGKWVGDLDVME
jgi:hypothetical protein